MKLLLLSLLVLSIGVPGITNAHAYDPEKEFCELFWQPFSNFGPLHICDVRVCAEFDPVKHMCIKWKYNFLN